MLGGAVRLGLVARTAGADQAGCLRELPPRPSGADSWLAGSHLGVLFQGTDATVGGRRSTGFVLGNCRRGRVAAIVGVCFREKTNFRILGIPQKPKMCPSQGQNRQIRPVSPFRNFHNISSGSFMLFSCRRGGQNGPENESKRKKSSFSAPLRKLIIVVSRIVR